MKAIILARVSTDEQMQEGFSIPAQLTRAREYADKKGLSLKSEYQFDESSTKDQRKKFEAVIKEIEASKEPIALVVETVDRLQRSFKESVLLDEYRKSGKLCIHFIRENLVISKDSNSSEIQRWDLAVFVAKSYVLQLSDNVKRSIDQKLKNGEWPEPAPLGYLNVRDVRDRSDVIPDPERASLIVKIFEYYANKTYAMNELVNVMRKLGLKGKGGKPLTKSQIHRILTNTFYHGVMFYRGQYWPHKYQPLISKELFDRAQAVRLGWKKKPTKYAALPFIFRGMITCDDDNCGCLYSPQIKKGRFIYYSCTNFKKKHLKKDYIPESELLKPVYEVLDNLKLPEDVAEHLVNDLRSVGQAEYHFHKESMDRLQEEYQKIETRISKLLDEKLDERITQDMYDKKLKEYKERQAEILDEMKKHDKADETFYITAGRVIDVANRAKEIFESSEANEKRQFLEFLLQNCRLSRKNLSFELKKPFDGLVQFNKVSFGSRDGTHLEQLIKSFKEVDWVAIGSEFQSAPISLS